LGAAKSRVWGGVGSVRAEGGGGGNELYWVGTKKKVYKWKKGLNEGNGGEGL